MKNMFKLFSALLLTVLIIGCSDKPSSSLIEEQNQIVSKTFNQVTMGQYNLVDFKVVKEGFTDNDKNKYFVQLTCSVDKPIYGNELKNLPIAYIFEKVDGKWKCVSLPSNIANFNF